MVLSGTKRWLLLAAPITILGVVAGVWISYEYLIGNFGWLFPAGDGPVPRVNEPVMTPGMTIKVKAPAGDLTITAGRGLKRSFSFDGGRRAIETWPRDNRWNGSRGVYFPGPGRHWVANNGIFRCVFDEGQLNFSSLEKAKAFLSKTPGCIKRFYRNDGLTVWISKSSGTLGVDIFQVYINGKKPNGLDGAQDESIEVDCQIPVSESTRAPEDSSDFNEKNAAYQAAKRASLCFYDSFCDRGEYFFKEKEYKNALRSYDEAIFAKPSVYLYLQQARCLMELRRYDQAIESLGRAEKLDPADKRIGAVRAEINRHRSSM